MAYNEELAKRIRAMLPKKPSVSEKKMFGGIGFLVRGNMACGLYKEYLIVRVGPDAHQEAIKKPHAKVFDITGRPMSGWVMVAPKGYETNSAMLSWLKQGIAYASSLPSK